ncbi:hypothetical protein [Endozoicomonas euniceicola]|uniref:Glycine zipper domain-containing protein n=1 Tax=Endozoicomonas euniceicola TaxID=1234143 RepID=A0ABY6GWQ0_9GAMM|nr:hypothetical protein [Endozoicomonas euniceicola]UYM16824.1 hypothetical protein NX720_02545 [Endozoicomonas euniceicola]
MLRCSNKKREIIQRFAGFNYLLIAICLMLAGCSSHQPLGTGVVLKEELITPTDRTDETKTGALAGVSLGSVIGAIAGAAAGAGCAAVTFGACAPAIPATVASGAAAGGAIGVASGAALGFGYGTYSQGAGLYRYSVLPCFGSSEVISLEQNSAALMPPGTEVIIYSDKKDNYRIKPAEKGDKKFQSSEVCNPIPESVP